MLFHILSTHDYIDTVTKTHMGMKREGTMHRGIHIRTYCTLTVYLHKKTYDVNTHTKLSLFYASKTFALLFKAVAI